MVKLYHGSSSENVCQTIIREKLLKPGNGGRGWMAPIKGCVYMTRSLDFAMSYVLNANVAGNPRCFEWERVRAGGQKGCLIVTDSKLLKSPQPDEDEVGELLDPVMKAPHPAWLDFLARKYVSPNTLREAGSYPHNSKIGKTLIRRMTQDQKYEILRYTKNVVNCGPIPVREVWQFDKSKCAALKHDGSNFFELAEKI